MSTVPLGYLGHRQVRQAADAAFKPGLKGAMVMTHSDAHSECTLRELSGEELDHVSGGMKWDRNTVNSDVIDARGGQFDLLWWTFTLDVNGNISSIS